MKSKEVLVALRARAGAVSAELRGELPHWQRAESLETRGDGWFETSLRLRPGIYEYKLAAPGGRWLLDEANPRTRARGGVQNSVLVVDGADEPVLHAPVAPWIERGTGGGLVVRAALRGGTKLGLRWDEGAGVRHTAMRPVGLEDEHVLFEAELPGAGRFLEYHFVLADGRVVGAGGRALRVDRRELPEPLPAWWRDAVVYSIFVDRFRRGGSHGLWSEARSDREFRAGGDLDGIAEALPHLVDLGVTALHLTPIVRAASPHRYDVVDAMSVDPALGGEAAFDRLLAECARRDVRLLLDVTVTHVHRSSWAFRHVAEHGPDSPYWPWFEARRFPFAEGPDPGYEHYQKGQWQEPLLRTGDEAVAEHLVGVFEHWARRGVAGFRVDAAADLPPGLCGRISAGVKAIAPDAVVFGEIVPEQLERWTATGALDAATDFAVRERLLAWLRGGAADRHALAANQARFRRGHDGARRLGFTANHDQPRLRSLVDAPAARLGHALTLLGAAVPMLYYGDELGLCTSDTSRDFEDSWPDRQCVPWAERDGWDAATLALIRSLAALRTRHDVLRRGDEEQAALGDDVLLLRRRLGGRVIDVVARRGELGGVVKLPFAGAEAEARLLFVHGSARIVEAVEGELELGGWSLAVVDRTPLPALGELVLRDGNAALAARAFAEGMTALPSYPSRLYVTVTEACNLRCAHCITDAPRLTAEGRDRRARAWLVDALAEPFAHADYLAFTHGGESLTSPALFELMAAFQRARAGRSGRADVHLVSNGMLLDETRVGRLLDLGLTSLMVSLDGATAAVNDRMRVGGSFARVIDNLRALLKRRGDLRVGISTVIGRGNREQLEALGSLCLELGVDWLKLEETYPATPIARLDRLPRVDGALQEQVSRLREQLGSIVLVDHLDPPGACPCAEPLAAGFRAADDFANRAVFRPCRMAWEQAAVDPDGTLHAVDYATPPLGRIGESDFLALWNARPAQQLRAAALGATTSERRAACVARDPRTNDSPPSRR